MTALMVSGVGVALPGVDKPVDALAPPPVPGSHWFDVASLPPGRGYRRLPPACQYLLVAANRALREAGDRFTRVVPERRGVVVATNNAAAALMDQQDRTILDAGANQLAPLTAAYFATSLFGSRLAAEHRVHGFALTVNSPRTAGLDAVGAGARALRAGRADALLVGATEETLPPGEPGWSRSDTGAVVLVCQAPSAGFSGGYATLRVRGGFLGPATPVARLNRLWDAVMDGQVPAVVHAILDDSPTGARVASWLCAREPQPTLTNAPAGCLSPLRRVAGLLANHLRDALVVTAAAEGAVTFARLTPPTAVHAVTDSPNRS